MPDEIIVAIEKIKKVNVALKAVRYNKETKSNEWSENLSNIEDDFKIKLNDADKRELLKKKEDLKKYLEKEKLYDVVVKNISNIFKFEKKIRYDGREVYKPTKAAVQTLNDSAELTGLLLKAYEISTSQIRRYLDSLRKIKATTSNYDAFNSADVLLQQVKVAYAAGKDKNLMFLYQIMKPALTEGCKDYHSFEQLLRFVEAIVAYHKFYRGED